MTVLTAPTAVPRTTPTTAPDSGRLTERQPTHHSKPTPQPRRLQVRRLPATAAGGTVTRRPGPDETGQTRGWDRMAFRPALQEGSRRAAGPGAAAAAAIPPGSVLGSNAAGADTGTPMPDPAHFAAVVVTAAAEVLSGHRSADHLARWTTPELFAALARRAGLARRLLGRAPTRMRPRSVHAQRPEHGTCEVTILLDDGARVRAAAARLEAFRGRWLLAALEIA
ncbi:Rv3235 family protein [Actinomyces ruminis]|nr:Rv3235 family protein [Actinomyces ruminis]